MLIQERYDRMDWLTYGNEQRKSVEARGEIKGAIKTYRRLGKMPTEIITLIARDFGIKQDVAEKYVEETLNLEMA